LEKQLSILHTLWKTVPGIGLVVSRDPLGQNAHPMYVRHVVLPRRKSSPDGAGSIVCGTHLVPETL
jgi:hypothetical protein